MSVPIWVHAAWIAIGSRLALFAVGLVAVWTLGHAPGMGAPPPNELAYLPARWDASWYVGVAAAGYRWEGPGHHNARVAFFPAYPMALRAAATVLRLPDEEPPWIWTGVVLSTLFFIGALLYLSRLTESLVGVGAGLRSMALLALSPFALFHGQVYSESLFLLAALGSVCELYRGKEVRSLGWGIAAGLCRPTAVLISLVLMSVAWPRLRPGRASNTPRVLTVLAVVAPAIGTAIYSAYLKLLTGQWLAWLTEQEGWGRAAKNPIRLFHEVVAQVAANGLNGYAGQHPYELINVLAAVGALACVIPVMRRLGAGWALFVLLSVLAPLRVGGFASMGRYTSVLFPIFIWMAGRSARWLPVWLVLFGVAQLGLAVLFFTDRPVY